MLVAGVGPRRLPYAMTAAMSTIFPSIYVDVQVVLASPVARAAAAHVGPTGLPLLAGAIGTGIFSGYVFVVPGLAVLLIAGQVDVSLGAWLFWGLLIGLTTALVTTFLFEMLLRTGYWKPTLDEDPDEAMAEVEAHDRVVEEVQDARIPSLPVAIAPIVVPLLMIAFGAFAELAGLSNEAISEGFHTSGEILLITGVGGALGAVISASGMGEELARLFSADASGSVLLSILLAWFIAAVLHLAIGSVSVAALTAAGIIGPIIPQLSVSPVVIGLAIASGALFAVHVNSNFFWMFKALLGLSTMGALKTLTVVTSLASVVSLPLVFLVSFIL